MRRASRTAPTAWRDLRALIALHLASRRGMVLGGIALAAATALAGMALLGVSGWFITATGIAGLSAAAALVFDVFAPAAAIRFLALARTGSRYGERLVTHDAALTLLAELRARLFRGWAQPGAAHLLLQRPARLLFRLTADIDALESLYLRVLVPLFAALGTALVGGLILGILDLRLGIGFVALLVAGGLGLPLLAARRARQPARRRAYAQEALRARVVDLVSGQTELAMAGQLHRQRVAVNAADHALAEADLALNAIETRTSVGFGIAGAAVLAGTLAAAGLLAEHAALSAPLAALAIMIAVAAMEPFAALRRGAVEFSRVLQAARRLAPRLADPATPPLPAVSAGPGTAFRLDAVTACHPGAAGAALEGLDLHVAAGERVAVVGPSGAGKSTLLALLSGEIAPAAGTLEMQAACLLPQRTELFRDTVRGNLLLADPAADDARLWAALEAAGLAGHIRTLPGGLDAPLGEDGLGLSGGQGRRLALARLLLRDTPVWLLDEPTEGLDAATARDVLARLVQAAAGRTLVVATHIGREAAIADRLIIMSHGRIIADLRRTEDGFSAALAALRPD